MHDAGIVEVLLVVVGKLVDWTVTVFECLLVCPVYLAAE